MTEIETLREQLLQQQKLASLGMLSAGIAHEIQNPLNFVINFSKMSGKLLEDINDIVDEIKETLDGASEGSNADCTDALDELTDISADLATNMQKIREHGERAISIIQGILLISRGKEGERLPTDIPHLVHEYVWLSYHAQRANDKSFNITINEDYQPDMKPVMVIPQDLSRAVLNVVNNACYAVHERKQKEGDAFSPTISVSVSQNDGKLIISIADNGCGIPASVRERLFQETVTTKPIGKGTGLGMQIVHSIIVDSHHGEIIIDSKENEGTTIKFVLALPPCPLPGGGVK